MLALAWNVTPLAAGLARGEADVTAHAAIWRAPLAYLHAHLQPGYRVEAVDTAEHWPAFYLAESGIPLVRGWFRQDDFPFDTVLYGHLRPAAYLRWLRELGVAYVVLTRSPPDYSSRQEALLVRSGRAGLRRVWESPEIAIYTVPHPRAIMTGPGRPAVLAVRESLYSSASPGRKVPRGHPLVAILACVHRVPFARARRDASTANARGGNGPYRFRRRRDELARRLRRWRADMSYRRRYNELKGWAESERQDAPAS
jgi:hypothetical protein